MNGEIEAALAGAAIRAQGSGPLYARLRRAIEALIGGRRIAAGEALPTERDIAELSGLSRVTVRRAVDEMVRAGLLVRRHGSGTFVARPVARVELPLSKLTSFTEDMARRGLATSSQWLSRGLFAPSPDETMALGLALDARVARFERLRLAADQPLAIERAAIAADILPDPDIVTGSLYAALETRAARPVRATQRIAARNATPAEAALLGIGAGDAVLQIERVSYLASGRAIEFTRSAYRGDAYDFVAELRLGDGEAKGR